MTASYYRILGSTFKQILNAPSEQLASMQEMDALVNQVSGTSPLYQGEIIMEYKPERLWLWQQYSGTILQFNVQTTLLNMGVCALFCIFAREATGLPFFEEPNMAVPFVARLQLVHEVWNYQTALTTFVLTFFVNQSFSFWNEIYMLTRDVQNHINNFNLVVATHTKRDKKNEYTKEAVQLLEEIGQFSRLYHILLWASKAKRFQALSTPEGLSRMESRGLMTSRQLKVLEELTVAPNQLYHAPLEWMVIRANQAMDKGVLADEDAVRSALLAEVRSMRNSARDISDKLEGRMPLAYMSSLSRFWLIPLCSHHISLFPDLGEFSVAAVGILTLFYTGLNNLAKIFLDPLNNEEYCENSMFMNLGVLIRETNAVSTLWMKAGKELPF
ncbi:unnamed protein product [Cylindrotheca closterium]|uniref:Bestrophin homolog n=1 Tax=Cylindrotheca closterium TaxID=2856 RepID=A0AAD2PVQ7_9STRA|nr:unnamed protein product [Cylindrotheca closterium]